MKKASQDSEDFTEGTTMKRIAENLQMLFLWGN